MIQIDKILKIAIEKKASDVHLIPGIRPTIRLLGTLMPVDGFDELTEDDMYELYDYFLRGNVEKDEIS